MIARIQPELLGASSTPVHQRDCQGGLRERKGGQVLRCPIKLLGPDEVPDETTILNFRH